MYIFWDPLRVEQERKVRGREAGSEKHLPASFWIANGPRVSGYAKWLVESGDSGGGELTACGPDASRRVGVRVEKGQETYLQLEVIRFDQPFECAIITQVSPEHAPT